MLGCGQRCHLEMEAHVDGDVDGDARWMSMRCVTGVQGGSLSLAVDK